MTLEYPYVSRPFSVTVLVRLSMLKDGLGSPSLSPKLRSMITKATHSLTITITIKMLRQRQQEVKGKMSKLRAEESATQTFKTKVQISTTKAETSGDSRDPSLSQRRLSANLLLLQGHYPGLPRKRLQRWICRI